MFWTILCRTASFISLKYLNISCTVYMKYFNEKSKWILPELSKLVSTFFHCVPLGPGSKDPQTITSPWVEDPWLWLCWINKVWKTNVRFPLTSFFFICCYAFLVAASSALLNSDHSELKISLKKIFVNQSAVYFILESGVEGGGVC